MMHTINEAKHRLATWNANALTQKETDFFEALAALKVDTMCLQEVSMSPTQLKFLREATRELGYKHCIFTEPRQTKNEVRWTRGLGRHIKERCDQN